MKSTWIFFYLSIPLVALAANIAMPRLNLTQSQYNAATSTSTPTLKLPDERRRLPVFPKSNKKFIVTPYVYRKYVTQNPVIPSKKPLMKKIVILERKPELVKIESPSKRSVVNTKFMNLKPKNVSIKTALQDNSQENMTNISKEFAKNSKEMRDDSNSEDVTNLIHPISEDNSRKQDVFTSAEGMRDKNILKVEDFIFTPNIKPTEAISLTLTSQGFTPNKYTTEGINEGSNTTTQYFIFTPNLNFTEVTTDSISFTEVDKSSTEDNLSAEVVLNVSPEEVADRNEFIFLDGSIEKKEDNIFKVSDDLLPTTEIIFDQNMRRKRSINVIEEENLGTTVSGFKFTVKDRNLISDLSFKNINS